MLIDESLMSLRSGSLVVSQFCISQLNSVLTASKPPSRVQSCLYASTSALLQASASSPQLTKRPVKTVPLPVRALLTYVNHRLEDVPAGMEIVGPASTLTEEQTVDFHAFKQAEKTYQLHREMIYRNAKGKMRLTGMRIVSTDFSRVLDFSDPATLTGHPHESIFIDAVQRPAFHLPSLPGFFILPGLLSAVEQTSLARSFLEELCEPPARTNHWIRHGYFEGLWRAYQASITAAKTAAQQKPPAQPQLQPQPPAKPPGVAGETGEPGPGQWTAARLSRREASGKSHEAAYHRAGALRLSDDCSNANPGGSQGPYARQARGQGESGAGREAAASASATDSGSHVGSERAVVPYERAWTSEGSGPSAEKILKKMRWVTLGPQFDWDRREYDPSLPYRPTPPSLLTLSEVVVDQVREAWEARHGPGTSGLPAAGIFKPDVALVNIYREGDTLNGHKDDVEKDMSLPIVTVSLGCECVFLVGGETKETEPVAMFVRSGDVIIMGGDVRRCFHGVPRVLPERGVPDWLNPLTCAEGFRPIAEYFSESRINISVRSTAEPTPDRLRGGE